MIHDARIVIYVTRIVIYVMRIVIYVMRIVNHVARIVFHMTSQRSGAVRLCRSLALSCMPLLASCIPVPHTLQDLPRVSGIVTEAGKPASGVVVHVVDVTRANPCKRAEQRASTDPAGRFVTSGRRRLALLVPLLPVHGVDTWALALFKGQSPVGWIRPWNYRAGPRYAPREVEISCELEDRKCLVHNLDWDRQASVTLRPCDQFSTEMPPD